MSVVLKIEDAFWRWRLLREAKQGGQGLGLLVNYNIAVRQSSCLHYKIRENAIRKFRLCWQISDLTS